MGDGGVDAALAAMDAAAQRRLLALAADSAGGSRAMGEFLPFAAAALASTSGGSGESDAERGLRVLAQAFASRHAAWTGAESLCSLERVPGTAAGRRQAAVLAAKVAQSALKSSAGGVAKPGGEHRDGWAGARQSSDLTPLVLEVAVDVVASMDLACCALYVAWTFESDARLGGLVIDNLLYQVAKKYSEVQQTDAQVSAARVLACTHLRLWRLHATLSPQAGHPQAGSSRFVALMRESTVDAVVNAARLPWLVEFPAPAPVHSAQYTRLLLGIANTGVTLMFSARQYEGIYKAAKDTLSRWIRHLDTSSAQDGKLATTLNDRIFRVLWKCASALEASPQFNGRISESGRFRALALSFMANCSTYPPLQIIQQVYRAGVQMERISKRREEDYKSVREFYMQSATLLSQKQPESRHIYVSKKLDWEYLQWIEHFASVCENAQTAIDSAILLESAVHYVWRLGELGQVVGRCMCCVIAGNLLDLATRTHNKPDSSADREKCDERLQQIASKVFAELMKPSSSSEAAPLHHWEKAARMFLKKTIITEEHALIEACSQLQQLVPFVTRCLKRGSSKLYSFATLSSSPVRSQLHAQISTSFDSFCSILQLLRSEKNVDSKLAESVIVTESRLRRLGFGLTIRGYSGKSRAPRDALISKQVESVQQLLDDVMSLETSATVIQAILADLNAVARESYACAARFYQSKNYHGTISALVGSFEIGESFLEYVMCSELSQEEIMTAHQQLKMDAIVSLLAFCYHEIGDLRHARIFSGHSVLYFSDPSGFSQTSIDKYVASILKECESRDEVLEEESLFSEFKGFVDGIISAFRARHCEDAHIVGVMHAFRRSFQRASDRALLTLRVRKEGGTRLDNQRALGTVRMCVHCGNVVDAATLLLSSLGDEARAKTLLSVCSAVAARTLCYSAYYLDQNAEVVIQGLLQAHAALASAVAALQSSDGSIELGAAYGWYGVLSTEIMLVSSYSGTPVPSIPAETERTSVFSEDSTLDDFEKCVMHLTSCSTTALFSTDRVVYCLEAVCEALSLISCPDLESAARNALQRLQSSSPNGELAVSVGPPPSFDWVETCVQVDEDATMDCNACLTANDESASIAQLFQMVDEDIAYAISFHGNLQQACRRLRRAASSLSTVKSKARAARPPVDVGKAIGMRQMILHLTLSDICFAQGKTESAFADAKAALAISWRLSKRFASHPSLDDTFHFKLPLELSNDGKSDGSDDSSALLYFKALEFSSWDILTGAKVALCRIATLYRAAGQPRRAATYYTEAMRLVGGLHLSLFNRDPFCQYAQLQLRSDRLQQARIALDLMPNCLPGCLPATSCDEAHRMSDIDLPSAQELDVRSRFRRQHCSELIQEGDLAWAEGDFAAAHRSYITAIKILNEVAEAGVVTKVFRTLRARCWRKLTKLLAETSGKHKIEGNGDGDFKELVSGVQELKTALDDCFDPVERVKCLLELGRHTLTLVAESPSAEQSLDEAIRLLESAFVRGDGIGIQHLSKELRVALGSAYHMQLEFLTSRAAVLTRKDIDCVCFLSQASGILLANSSSVEVSTDAFRSESGSDSSAEDYFSTKLDELIIQHEQSQEEQPCAQVKKYVEAAMKQSKRLPASWLTVSINVGVSSDLLLTRFSSHDDSPATFRLVGVQWKEIMSELHTIVEESRITLSGHSVEEAGAWSSEQKRRWWDTRKQLDTRMGDTIRKLQTALGFWRALLVKGSTTTANQTVQQCWAMLSTASSSGCQRRLQTLLCAMIDSLKWLSDVEIRQGLQFITQQLGVAVSPSDIARACQLLRDGVSEGGDILTQCAEVDLLSETQLLSTMAREAIQKMKVGEMKELLSAVGLSTSGLKKDLLGRLLTARDDFNRSQRQSRSAAHPPSRHLEESTVMILDRCLLEFPWEGIDVLNACGGVTRMPSLDLIVKNASRFLTSSADPNACASWRVDRRRVRYVLNPSGDLKSTQKQLRPILEQNADALGWEGIVGCAPDPHEYRRFLVESDLLIYCGHGSGEKYLHRDKIRDIESGCSAALLFGCSSGRLESEGIFGPDGAVLSYLRAGSPGVLAMLWDVTDKDIDQLSVRVLQQWLLPAEEGDGTGGRGRALAHVVQASRDACKLQFLNGHAVVCYGLPLHVSTGDD